MNKHFIDVEDLAARRFSGRTMRRQLWNSTIPVWGLIHLTNPAETHSTTIQANFSIETDCVAIRLILQNQGAAALTVSRLVVASSCSNENETTPFSTPGTLAPWNTVTVDGSAEFSIPAAASSEQPHLMLSDTIPLESVPRTDGGQFPLIFARLLIQPNTEFEFGIMGRSLDTDDNIKAYTASTGGRYFQSFFFPGDFVTRGQLADLLTEDLVDGTGNKGILFGPVVGVQYICKTRCYTIMGIGDSLTRGFVTTSGLNGFVTQAARSLATDTASIATVNLGYTAQGSSDFVANGKNAIRLLKPQVITLPIDSPNDYTGVAGEANIAATRRAAQARILDLADYAIRKGILVVLLTPLPFASYDTNENFGPDRVLAGNLLRSLVNDDLVVVDAQKIISGFVPTMSRLPVIPRDLLASDKAHLNDAAHALIASKITERLQDISVF